MASIAIDLDSTLYDFESAVREAFLKLADQTGDKAYFQGAYVPYTEWRTLTDVCGFERGAEAIRLCHEADAISQQVPFAGAVDTCQALADEGHELLYISNRAAESNEATFDWLADWGFFDNYDHELVCTMDDKEPYLRDCQYLIDDRPKTCVQFIYDLAWGNKVADIADWPVCMGRDAHKDAQSLRRRAFMKAYPYNQNLTDIPGLYLAPTWSGLNYYLVSKGVLSEPAVIPTLKV